MARRARKAVISRLRNVELVSCARVASHKATAVQGVHVQGSLGDVCSEVGCFLVALANGWNKVACDEHTWSRGVAWFAWQS